MTQVFVAFLLGCTLADSSRTRIALQELARDSDSKGVEIENAPVDIIDASALDNHAPRSATPEETMQLDRDTDAAADAVEQVLGDHGADGEIQVTFAWHNHDHLQFKVEAPEAAPKSDENQKSGIVEKEKYITQVQHIRWPTGSEPVEGIYKVLVRNYVANDKIAEAKIAEDATWTVIVSMGNKVIQRTRGMSDPRNEIHRGWHEVAEFNYKKNPGASSLVQQSQEKTAWSVLDLVMDGVPECCVPGPGAWICVLTC